MDPLTLLPSELWRLVVGLLPLDALVTLGQVCRGWRQFFREPHLWENTAVEVGKDPKPSDVDYTSSEDGENGDSEDDGSVVSDDGDSEWEDVTGACGGVWHARPLKVGNRAETALLEGEQDRAACRVLRAAPCLKTIVIRGWQLSRRVKAVLQACQATVSLVGCAVSCCHIET